MKPISLALAITLCICISISAQVPETINYQGRLVDGTNLVNGDIALELRLYDAVSAGTLLYSDSQTVTVVDGLYSTYIGDDTIFGDLEAALTNTMVYLEPVINSTALSPRERLVSVPYALISAQVAGGIDDADADPTNEHNTAFAFTSNVLSITDGGGMLSQDLSSLKAPNYVHGASTGITFNTPIDVLTLTRNLSAGTHLVLYSTVLTSASNKDTQLRLYAIHTGNSVTNLLTDFVYKSMSSATHGHHGGHATVTLPGGETTFTINVAPLLTHTCTVDYNYLTVIRLGD